MHMRGSALHDELDGAYFTRAEQATLWSMREPFCPLVRNPA